MRGLTGTGQGPGPNNQSVTESDWINLKQVRKHLEKSWPNAPEL